jgi:hypothetical protein
MIMLFQQILITITRLPMPTMQKKKNLLGKSSNSNLQNRRPSHNSRIINTLRTIAKHQITLALHARRRNLNTEINPIPSLRQIRKNRPPSRNKSSIKLRTTSSHKHRASTLDRNRRAGYHRPRGRRGNRRIRFDGQRRVSRRAGLDERRRESVDCVRRERDVLRRRERAEFLPRRRRAQERRVARLNSQNRPSNGQVVFVRDLAGGAEVRADTDALENAGDGEELCDRRHGEGVGAFFGRGGAESGGEEVDVRFLVAGDLG